MTPNTTQYRGAGEVLLQFRATHYPNPARGCSVPLAIHIIHQADRARNGRFRRGCGCLKKLVCGLAQQTEQLQLAGKTEVRIHHGRVLAATDTWLFAIDVVFGSCGYFSSIDRASNYRRRHVARAFGPTLRVPPTGVTLPLALLYELAAGLTMIHGAYSNTSGTSARATSSTWRCKSSRLPSFTITHRARARLASGST